jgi:three-Cys-motif partner protein
MEVMQMAKDWFDKAEPESKVKIKIVSKYFDVWAQIMKNRSKKISYIDLFSGPGFYKDGTKSTPILVVENAIKNIGISDKFMSFFNDCNTEYVNRLKNNIVDVPSLKNLRHQPEYHNFSVDNEIIKNLPNAANLGSILLFLDPWGLKGVSLELINNYLMNWGCDCIVFFNSNAINRFLRHKSLGKYIDDIFGREGADTLKREIIGLNLNDRIRLFLRKFEEALKEEYAKYFLSFCFKKRFRNKQVRVSHYLIFITKHLLGHNLMKEIMGPESSRFDQGVPSFEFFADDKNYHRPLVELSLLDDLCEMLLKDFAGRKIIMREIYEKHNVGKPYIKKNYKEALKNLEKAGKISIESPNPAKKRSVKTCSDDAIVTFLTKDDLNG